MDIGSFFCWSKTMHF